MENRPSAPGGAGGGGRNSGNPSRNRKPRNKRSRRKGDNSRRNAGGGNRGGINQKRNKGPPSPPQTKIVIRNIGDVTKYGTIKDVVGLIRSVISGANQKLLASTSRLLQLEEASIDCLIQEEEAVLKAQQEEKEDAKKEQNGVSQEENEATIPNDHGETILETEEVKGETYKEAATKHLPESDLEASTTNLGARVVYIVPPKQTRRRGIKPGCAYLVISGPRIEAKDPPPAPEPEITSPADAVPTVEATPPVITPLEAAKEEETSSPAAVAEEPKESPPDDDNIPKEEPTPSAEDCENHVVIVEPTAKTNNNGQSELPPPPPVAMPDYSREVAQGRFLVIQAIDIMEALTKEDAKADQIYSGSMVEVAMSGKTYKHQFHRRDRREGTLEQTDDYKRFLEDTAKAKEERMARPKPAPGGGATQSMVTLSTDAAENGQPIAALVEHIRSKRAEASKRKKAKKKAKESSNKEKGIGGKSSRKKKAKDGAKEEGGKKGGRKKDGKKSKRAGKKKNGKGGVTSAAPTAPTLLKPGTAGSGPPGPIAPPAQQPAASLPGMNGVMGGFQGYG